MTTATARTYTVADITHGPVDIWLSVAAPGAAALATIDVTAGVATPDATANPSAYHLGLSTGGAELMYKPSTNQVFADELTSPYRSILEAEEVVISPKGMLQAGQNLVRANKLMVGGTLTAPGTGDKITVGGLQTITYFTVMALWMQADSATKYNYWILYKAFNDAGLALQLTRKNDAASDITFRGFADSARTQGDQVAQLFKLS